jgi:hypothetical protein
MTACAASQLELFSGLKRGCGPRIEWVRRPLFDRILQMSHPFHCLASRNNHELVGMHELVDLAESHAASKGNR